MWEMAVATTIMPPVHPRDGSVADSADIPPRHRIDRPSARTATLPASPSACPMTTVRVSGLARKAVEPSTMSMMVVRLPPSFAALLPPQEDEKEMPR